MTYTCPACGYPKLEDPPYRQSRGGSDEIRPSCGIHFGNDDVMADNDSERHDIYARWRAKWVDHGMEWFSRSAAPPPHWDPQTQLENPSCGIQFGYHDARGEDDVAREGVYTRLRQAWIAGGMKWHDKDGPPPNWHPANQLRNVKGQ